MTFFTGFALLNYILRIFFCSFLFTKTFLKTSSTLTKKVWKLYEYRLKILCNSCFIKLGASYWRVYVRNIAAHNTVTGPQDFAASLKGSVHVWNIFFHFVRPINFPQFGKTLHYIPKNLCELFFILSSIFFNILTRFQTINIFTTVFNAWLYWNDFNLKLCGPDVFPWLQKRNVKTWVFNWFKIKNVIQ